MSMLHRVLLSYFVVEKQCNLHEPSAEAAGYGSHKLGAPSSASRFAPMRMEGAGDKKRVGPTAESSRWDPMTETDKGSPRMRFPLSAGIAISCT